MKIIELFEAIRPAYLYHSTTIKHASSIILGDEIKAMTAHTIDAFDIGKKYAMDKYKDTILGISLTRSLPFARSWDDVVFVLNQEKLRQKYKMIEIDYNEERWNTHAHGEAEEFLIGSIKPLSKYLIKILISDDNYNYAKNSIYKSILKHPKIEIQGKKWENGLVTN